MLKTTHVHVGFDPSDVPTAGSGQPIPGQFTYQHTREDGTSVTHDEFAIPFTDLDFDPETCGNTIYIWAHAEACKLDDNGDPVQEETAFGGDTPGTGTPRWFFLASYTLQCCDDPAGPGGDGEFRTQTQGGWGTVCHGENPGCYRNEWFDVAFPNGIELGCTDGFNALFTSSEAIRDFLPTGGKPGSLTGDITDPTAKTDAGVLIGQLLALELSLAFDIVDPDFGSSTNWLGDQIVCNTGTACDGLTIAELADEANLVLGGCEGTTGLGAGELSECLDIVNENFVDGETNNGNVCTP